MTPEDKELLKRLATNAPNSMDALSAYFTIERLSAEIESLRAQIAEAQQAGHRLGNSMTEWKTGARGSADTVLELFKHFASTPAIANPAADAKDAERLRVAIRKVLQHHGIAKHGDGVIEADLIAAMKGEK